MHRSRCIKWIVLPFVMLFFHGCDRDNTKKLNPLFGSAKPQVAKVVLAVRDETNDFYRTMIHAAKAHQRANASRYELIVVGMKGQGNIQKQVQCIKDLIDQRVQAIVLSASDNRELVPAVENAISKGIAVVAIDERLDKTVFGLHNLRIPYAGSQDADGAYRIGLYMADRLTTGAEVAILEGLPSRSNSRRKEGIMKAISDRDLTLVETTQAKWERDLAKQVTSDFLQKRPNLRGIFALNDTMAIGATDAVFAAQKKKDILISGFENLRVAQPYLADKRILVTGDPHAEQIGVEGIETALAITSGRTDISDYLTTVSIVTAETLSP